MLGDARPSSLAHALAQLRVTQQAVDSIGECLGIAWWDEQAGHIVYYHFGSAAYRSSDNW